MPASLNNAVSNGPKDSAHAFHQQASTAGTYRINNILYYLLFIPIMWKVYEGKSTYRRPLLSEGLHQGAPTKPVLGSAHLFAARPFFKSSCGAAGRPTLFLSNRGIDFRITIYVSLPISVTVIL